MISNKLDDVLSLLAITIMADKRVFSTEIESFLKVANNLPCARLIDPSLSEARLLNWYEMNKGALRKKVNGSHFKPWFYDCLGRIGNAHNKEDLQAAIHKIALSDGDLHFSEQALMVLTARYWNIQVKA